MSRLRCLAGLAVLIIALAVVAGAMAEPLPPGPWGRLTAHRIYLEPPVESAVIAPSQIVPLRWYLADVDRDQFSALLREAGISMAVAAELAAAATLDDRGLVLEPPTDWVRQLAADQRAHLYGRLWADDRNLLHAHPFRWPVADLDAWFRGTGVRPQVRQAVIDLTYRIGDAALFSDLALIIPLLQTEDEYLELLQTLMRTRSLVLELELDETSDLVALTEYWSVGVKRKEVLPLLRSWVRSDATAGLDVTHLLTPHARQLLYTFPDWRNDPDFLRKDCNWSTFNFYRPTVDMSLGEPAVQDRMLAERFVPAAPPWRFGDLLTMAYPGQDFFHSGVYVAADVIYTKNGAAPISPWVLMHLDDLRAVYYARRDWEIRGYRLLEQ